MDTYVLIIAASAVIIFSFFFNIFAKKTNIPSVLMLIVLGVLLKLGAEYADVEIKANMLNTLQVLGNVGLVMIVLEAALDLELTKEKRGLIVKSFLVALVALVGSSFSVAAIIYFLIDSSDFYSNPVEPAYRSRMNVPFILADESLESLFLQESEAAGLRTLAGHRTVGGMRASIYNAMPMEGIEALIDFMRGFEQRHG